MEALKGPVFDSHAYYYDKPKVAAIDPCTLCVHKDLKSVDSRCSQCQLRGKRFFEVQHATA